MHCKQNPIEFKKGFQLSMSTSNRCLQPTFYHKKAGIVNILLPRIVFKEPFQRTRLEKQLETTSLNGELLNGILRD